MEIFSRPKTQIASPLQMANLRLADWPVNLQIGQIGRLVGKYIYMRLVASVARRMTSEKRMHEFLLSTHAIFSIDDYSPMILAVSHGGGEGERKSHVSSMFGYKEFELSVGHILM